MESLIPNPPTQNATKTDYFSEQTKFNKTKVCDSRREITRFAWLTWTIYFPDHTESEPVFVYVLHIT